MKSQPTYTNIDLIAIVDPRPMFRKGFRQTLAQLRKSTEIVEADNCQELEQKYPDRSPDIIFVAGSGFSDIEILGLAGHLKRYSPAGALAIYDNRNPIDFLLTFFRESIGGYLREDFNESDLDMCINTLAAGLHYVNSEIAYELITQKPASPKRQQGNSLSGLERKVAGCLIRGMSTSQIAETLDRRSSTISTVKSNIFKKTKVYNIIDLATTLRKQGAPLATFLGGAI